MNEASPSNSNPPDGSGKSSSSNKTTHPVHEVRSALETFRGLAQELRETRSTFLAWLKDDAPKRWTATDRSISRILRFFMFATFAWQSLTFYLLYRERQTYEESVVKITRELSAVQAQQSELTAGLQAANGPMVFRAVNGLRYVVRDPVEMRELGKFLFVRVERLPEGREK